MEREKQSIEIGSHKLVVKTYATAREANAIQQAYLVGTKIEVVGEQPKISEFNPGVQFEVQKELIKQMAVSLDESEENVVERCLDLRSNEFNDLIAQLDDLVAKKKS